jgi:hypothetical protein
MTISFVITPFIILRMIYGMTPKVDGLHIWFSTNI